MHLITDDRNVEQFLYAHRIAFGRQYRENGKTYWLYPVNERLLDVLREYMALYEEALPHENAHRIL